MNYLELKYVNLVSSRLRNFKVKNNTINFSCPLCNDSKHNIKKARGYIYEREGKSFFHCHNCGASMSAMKFIEKIDEGLYKEYVLESFQNNKKSVSPEDSFVDKFIDFRKANKLFSKLKKVSQLPYNHPCKEFVDRRKIPTTMHYKLFYCPNFMNFTNEIIPNKFSEEALIHDEARLLIPFYYDKNVHAFQGRSLRPKSDMKYITIVIDEKVPKIYGQDTVNFKKKIPVFEGPIDSMFINNSLATAGGDLVSSLYTFDKKNLIIVYDNEPRSRETIKKIDKAINQGYNVCIFPKNIEQKDINDMILNGILATDIEKIITENSFSGMEAKVRLENWRRIK